jgi:hypothetical protein
MTDHADPVDAVILAFLDHLEGGAARPTLDHLTDADQRRARAYLDGLVTARGINPHASRPSVEALLVDTPLAGLLPATPANSALPATPAEPANSALPATPAEPANSALPATQRLGPVDPNTVRQVLAAVDDRIRVDLDPDGTVILSYLDLRARFVLVPTSAPVVTEKVRAQVRTVFDADPDTGRVGVVAARSDDLATQMLAADEVGQTITTPRGEPHTRLEPPLPLALAARRMLEQAAPEWPRFDFDRAGATALDVAAIAAEVAARVIRHESSRSYRGDKRRAYRSLVGQEHIFADLVARISAGGTDVDLDAETTRITRAAA